MANSFSGFDNVNYITVAYRIKHETSIVYTDLGDSVFKNTVYHK